MCWPSFTGAPEARGPPFSSLRSRLVRVFSRFIEAGTVALLSAGKEAGERAEHAHHVSGGVEVEHDGGIRDLDHGDAIAEGREVIAQRRGRAGLVGVERGAAENDGVAAAAMVDRAGREEPRIGEETVV